QLRSPSPSEMDPTDARDEDGRPPSSPLENLRRPESPEPTNSASEYPSPPQRGTKLNDGHDTIDGVLDDSAERSRATPFKLNTTFQPPDNESRQRSSSPLAVRSFSSLPASSPPLHAASAIRCRV